MNHTEREIYKQNYPLHNLTLMDTYVRLYIEYNPMYFHYKDYGSKEEAIAAAKQKRDSYPPEKIHSFLTESGPKGSRTSPYMGVSRYFNTRTGEWIGYMARWQQGSIENETRTTRNKCFHFRRYSDPLKMAIEHRENMHEANKLSNLFINSSDIKLGEMVEHTTGGVIANISRLLRIGIALSELKTIGVIGAEEYQRIMHRMNQIHAKELETKEGL